MLECIIYSYIYLLWSCTQKSSLLNSSIVLLRKLPLKVGNNSCGHTSSVMSAKAAIREVQFLMLPENLDSANNRGTVRCPRPHSKVT